MTDKSTLFREKFTRAFQQSKFSSYRQLSLQAGCSEPTVQQIISGKFDGSTSGPGIFTFHRLATALGASMDSFLEDEIVPPQKDLSVFNDPGRNDQSSFDALMATHWRGGGRLEAFADVEGHLDLYLPPKEDSLTPKIKKMGRFSLMSRRLETTDTTIAQREIDRLPLALKREVIDFHSEVIARGIVCGNTFLDHQLTTKPVYVRAGYSRLGLRVEDPSGRTLIAVACKPIPV